MQLHICIYKYTSRDYFISHEKTNARPVIRTAQYNGLSCQGLVHAAQVGPALSNFERRTGKDEKTKERTHFYGPQQKLCFLGKNL